METAFDIVDGIGYFSSDQRKWINKVNKFKESNPDDVTILKTPQENDGCIYAILPANWFKISLPRKVELSQDRRQEMADRLKNYRINNRNQAVNEVE